MPTNKQANRLINEKSPYLLQHAHNPVDWFPWSEEAFEKAKAEDKPIFLSIGYSTCHWCHVMAHESFEDEEVAEILNRHFISIKVDREERPDIDHIYMTVCQALTGHGGWPLSIFLTPEGKPFYAGTYFPKKDRMGMPGFITLLLRIKDAWENHREGLLQTSAHLIEVLNQEPPGKEDEISENIFPDAYLQLSSNFDPVYGGFGNAPKFPTPHILFFLLRYWHHTGEPHALEMVEKTLSSMHQGGIYDHIGFGFSRYSTDRKWLVPHFEKMLYDNALLAIAYLEAYQATGKQEYSKVARQIFTYVLRDMTSSEGGFYSAEDADSEGEEGKFYLWTPEEVMDALGSEDGGKYCRIYHITEKGNFEDKNIPHLIQTHLSEKDEEFAEQCRQKLFACREKRIRPFRDDKILTSWNGLMIAALSIGGKVLKEEQYTHAAVKAVDFIRTRLTRENGRLMARYRDGETAHLGYIDDYAFFIWGLLELYETTHETRYLEEALRLNNDMIRLFWDETRGGFFIYGSDSKALISRPKEVYDGATPSGNSVAAYNLLRLARLTGNHQWEEIAHQQFLTFSRHVSGYPAGHAFMLIALMYFRFRGKEIIIAGGRNPAGSRKFLEVLNQRFLPFVTSVFFTEDMKRELENLIPYIVHYNALDDKATAFVCENFSCMAPVTDPAQLENIL